jgi:tetratricopeptide (TPR) repeat protein
MDTSRDGLAKAIASLEARAIANRADESAAVGLADALMRQARVVSDAELPLRAERALRSTIRETDGYLSRRMLGAVLLAQHRFAEAIEAGRSAQALRPDDPWNLGVIGDAALELGRYDEAFAAFDRMATLRPNAASYARISYARELQGDIDGAIDAMRMAIEATSPRDAEALAWHWSQVGALERAAGRFDLAGRAYGRALHAFPGHPYALGGRARLVLAIGDVDQAMREFRALFDAMPTPELGAAIGDIHARRGEAAEARRMWAEAERLEREGWKREAPQPGALARMLAERDLKPDEAVRLAREASQSRDDIHTNDALAWALFRIGDLEGAWTASRRARRTGTKDTAILAHAAAIDEARRDARR